MTQWLRSLWAFEIQALPVLIGLAIVEIPAFIQRRFRLAYVPIYFAVFPLAELNKDLSVYLGEDFWYGGELSEDEAEQLRRKILFKALLSMTIASLAIPLLAGFSGTFFLTSATLTQFLIVAVILKLSRIIRAVRDFPSHANGTPANRALLSLIYFFYLGVFVQMIVVAYRWTHPFVERREWPQLAAALSDLLFTRVVAQVIVLGLLTASFVSLIADRRLRRQNLAGRAGGLLEEGSAAPSGSMDAPPADDSRG